MTTITNFLHGKFITHQTQLADEKQVPIWVLNGTRQLKTNRLCEYLIEQCVSNNRPLMHIDLGLRQVKKKQDNQQLIIQFDKDNNLPDIKLLKPFADRCYYVFIWSRHTEIDLVSLVRAINQLNDSEVMRKETVKGSMGLFVEGLELLSTLRLQIQIQNFINQLSNLHKIYKQITIVNQMPQILKKQHRFALQRISTCLTDIIDYNKQSSTWTCRSTVRRYTGFSNEQQYVIKLDEKNSRMKVQKWAKCKEDSETEAQKEMIGALGFAVKKNEQSNKQQQELKKLIYPHLKIQEGYQCVGHAKEMSGECPKCRNQQGDEDLIVLDDEQEDQDDIDV